METLAKYPHFIAEEAEVQRDKITCSKGTQPVALLIS